MRNIKRMTQNEYDNYLLMDVIPDLQEEHGEFDSLILGEKCLQFARTCKKCKDLIPVGRSYKLREELVDLDSDFKTRYFEILTELEVVSQNQVLECECYDEKDEDGECDEMDEYDELQNHDFYTEPDDDYGDGNYEY